jgi:hypothetical protein
MKEDGRAFEMRAHESDRDDIEDFPRIIIYAF